MRNWTRGAVTDGYEGRKGEFASTDADKDLLYQTKTRSALKDVVTREYTIHLHKRVHGASFKKSE